MKKILLILILISSSIYISAQNIYENTKMYLSSLNYKIVSDGIKGLDLKKRTDSFNISTWEESMDIVADYAIVTININKELAENHKRDSSLKIELLKKGNNIIFYELFGPCPDLYALSRNCDTNNTLVYNNEEALQQFGQAYKNIYGIFITPDDLFKYEGEYGIHCGYAGISPKLRMELWETYDSKDTAAIISWLQYPIIEKQIYAIEAIYSLNKFHDIEFDKRVWGMIEAVKQRRGRVSICQGCVFGQSEEISKLIEEIEPRSFWINGTRK